MNCGRAVMPLRIICCVHHCRLLPILETLPCCRALAINGSGSKLPLLVGDSWCASPTAGDGRWGSRERERGRSRRLSNQPSRPRLRRRLASPCRRASCCPRDMAIVHSNLAGVTGGRQRARVRTQTTARRAGSTVVERTSCACWPRWRRQPGVWGWRAPEEGGPP